MREHLGKHGPSRFADLHEELVLDGPLTERRLVAALRRLEAAGDVDRHDVWSLP